MAEAVVLFSYKLLFKSALRSRKPNLAGKTGWVMLGEHPLGLLYLVGQKKRLAKSCQILIFGGSHVSSHLIHRSSAQKRHRFALCRATLKWVPQIVLSMIVCFMFFLGYQKET